MSPGRLTYTSAAASDRRGGGWQVNQEQGLTDQEREHALDLVATSLPVPDPPRFPSPEEVEALPRRLLVAVSDDDGGGLVLVHSVAAGPDATGRPGNVFNHVVVLRPDDLEQLGVQAIELWRSPDWLVPWGPEGVRAAVLGEHAVPRPGPVVDRHAVAQRLADVDEGEGRALASLADALGLAVDGGEPVVAVVDDQDRGVLRLACVLLPLGPAVGSRLTFSTWERAAGVRAGGGLPMVSLVPREDVGALLGTTAVVLDPAAAVPGDPTPWSALSRCLWGRPAAFVAERLEAVVDIAELNPLAAQTHLLWPLAVAVAESGLDPGGQALHVLLRVGHELVEDDQTRADVRGLLQQALGTTVGEAAEVLTRFAEVPGVDAGVLAELLQVYLRRALADDCLLAAPWPPPLPYLLLPPRARVAMLETLTEGLGQLVTQQPAPVDRAVAALHGLDLGELLELRPGLDLSAEAALLAARLLVGPDGDEVLRRAQPLMPGTVRRLLPHLDAECARLEHAGTVSLSADLSDLVRGVADLDPVGTSSSSALRRALVPGPAPGDSPEVVPALGGWTPEALPRTDW